MMKLPEEFTLEITSSWIRRLIFLKNMILTSSLYESIGFVKEFLDKNAKSKKILFIPTAANVEEYKNYMYLTEKAFEDIGYEVDNFDISVFSEKTVKEKLSKAEIIFISGGNTFYLLQELKRKNLISYLKERIENGLLYIGESAGSVITGPNIEYASLADDKTLAKELSDYTGMNLIDFYLVPHFGEEPFAESSEKIVELYKDKLDLELINNKEVILIENDDFRIIKEKNKKYICGHVHNLFKSIYNKNNFVYNVSVELNNYSLVSLYDIIEEYNNLHIYCIDTETNLSKEIYTMKGLYADKQKIKTFVTDKYIFIYGCIDNFDNLCISRVNKDGSNPILVIDGNGDAVMKPLEDAE